MSITYKTVIASAIAHFNDIQNALNIIGTTVGSVSTDGALLPTVELYKRIRNETQAIPADSGDGTLKVISGNLTFENNSPAIISLKSSKFQGINGSDTTYVNIVPYSRISIPKGTVRDFNTTTGTLSVDSAGWFNSGETLLTLGVASIKSGGVSSFNLTTPPTGLNSSTNKYDFKYTASIAAPSVSTSGYISSTNGTRTGNSSDITISLSKAGFTSTKDSSFTPVIGQTTNSVTDRIRITNATVGIANNFSNKYYIALATDSQTSKTVTTKTTESGAGYILGNETVGTTTIGLNASSTTYASIPKVNATIGLNTFDPSLEKGTTTGNTNITSGSLTTKKPSTGYYQELIPKADFSKASFSKTLTSSGYVGDINDITFSTPSGVKNPTYYLPIQQGSFTITSTSALTDNIPDTSADSTILLKNAPARIAFKCISNGVGAPGIGNKVDYYTAATGGSKVGYSSLTSGVTYYYEDFYTITSSATNAISSSTVGYIGNPSSSSEISLSNTPVSYYLPRAKFRYVSDSTSGNFIEVSSSGFVQSGTIELINGTLDTASVPVSVSVGSLSNGAYNLSVSKGSINAGYISNTEGTVSTTSKLPQLTATGGGISVATGVKNISTGNTNIDATINSGTAGYTDYYIELSHSGRDITRSAVTVKNSGYNTSGSSLISSSTTTGGANTSIKAYIKSGSAAASAPSYSGNSSSPAASGGTAIYSTSKPTDTNAKYVIITGNKGTLTKTEGYIPSGTSDISATTLYISASTASTVTSGTTSTSSASAALKTGTYTASSYTTTDGTTTLTKRNTGTYTISSSGTVDVSASVKDKYMLNSIGGTASFSASKDNSVAFPDDATGSMVDKYVLNLYKRMLGQSYESVEADK